MIINTNICTKKIPKNEVIFLDYDGTVVERWDTAKVSGKTALPNNPTHTRLIAQGWNWSLANIKSYISKYEGSKLVVGQMYKTVSGLTEFDITITKVTGLTVTCDMVGNKNWGDGTQDALTSHTYTDYGDYTITCDGTSIPQDVFAQSLSSTYMCINAFIGDTVTSIDNKAFGLCYSLANVTIPATVTSIGNNAFFYCYSLLSVTIPSGVTSIGSSAFYYCYSLANVTIPDGVTSIGNNAFYSCHALTNITIPDGVTSIGNYAFDLCCAITNVTIPDGVTSIGNKAFQSCYSLTNITIPDDVTSIGGSEAFRSCYALTSITIPDGVTSIGSQAFQNCYSLAHVTIPATVTSIGSQAFQNCYSLPNITIPDGVTSIGSQAFQNCYSITKYDFTAATVVPTLANINAFTNINGICKIVVPDALYNDWIVATNWSTYADYIYKASEVTN